MKVWIILIFIFFIQSSVAFSSSDSQDQTTELKARHHKCLAALENYFTNDVPLEDMKFFLQVQYELVVYKTFGTILTQKILQAKKGDTQIRNKSLQEVLTDNLDNMPRRYEKWPAFREAAKLFDAKPLAVDTFAELLPFLQDYLSKEKTLYDTEPGKSFMLNYRDLKMLHVMAEMETMFTEEEKKPRNRIHQHAESFLVKLNRLNADILFGKNIDKTQEDVYILLVVERIKQVNDFMAKLKLPTECAQERKTLTELFNGSDSYYNRHEDTVASLINMSREVADTLFDSINKRTDLQYYREMNLRAPMFYYGVNSPWGRYE